MEKLIETIKPKDTIAWRSIQNSILHKKKINKSFVEFFEKKESLINNKNWKKLKKEISYI